MFETPAFPAREMYSNVPGPVLLLMRKLSNQILLSVFSETELSHYRRLLAANDPIHYTQED